MTTKQILFRLDESTATKLESKLNEKGLSKQSLFNKVVELFIKDKLSFDNNMIITGDNKKITIDSNEVVEDVKKQCLSELTEMIANDSNLIAINYPTLAHHLIKEDELIEKVSDRVKKLLAPLEDLRREITIDVLNEVRPVIKLTTENDDPCPEEETPEESNEILQTNLDIALDNEEGIKPLEKSNQVDVDTSTNSIEDAPKELLAIPSGESIDQTRLAKILGKGTSTISRWINKKVKNIPPWFFDYLDIQRDEKGKAVISRK